MDLGEPEAKRLKLDRSICIICLKSIPEASHKDIVQNPTVTGLETLLDIAEAKHDRVNDLLRPHRQDILSHQVNVRYHRVCRATYTNKFYSSDTAPKSDDVSSSRSESPMSPELRRSTRDSQSGFNIRENCFICGSAKKIGNRKEPLSGVSTGTGESTRQKTVNAATLRNDQVVISRMQAYGDLFAYDAKYHRSCYGHYISKRNVSFMVPHEDKVDEPVLYEEAFQMLLNETKQTIFSETKSVVTLSDLNIKYIQFLGRAGVPDELANVYKSWKLKQRLEKQFGEDISFFQRKGQSDLVCSSAVSVGAVLHKASKLKSELDESNEYKESKLDIQGAYLTDRQILYGAAGILRRAIKDIQSTTQAYRLQDLSIDACSQLVPGPLYDFIIWLVNAKAFDTATGTGDEVHRRDNIQVLATCHNVISQSKRILTPINLGLALTAYHDFGSSKLVRTLYTLGYSVSYEEVLRFITSAAKQQLSQEGVPFVPFGIHTTNTDDNMGTVHAAIDNFDTNEHTLDGKETTHSMAMVVYQRCDQDRQISDVEIPRLSERSIGAGDYGTDMSSVTYFQKPPTRPAPDTVANAANFYIDGDNDHIRKAVVSDLSWALCRSYMAGLDNIPAWSGYNSVTTKASVPITTVRYLPFIDAPPSDNSTIFTALNQLVRLAAELGQNHIIVTADLAIYSKAREILWTKPACLEGKVTLRLGGMHHTMAFLASIGKLFGDGGLLSLLTESDVYSDVTARQMLTGAQLTRGVRGMKVILDAMCRCFFDAFIDWVTTEKDKEPQPQIGHHMEKLRDAIKEKDVETAKEIRETLEAEFQDTLDLISEFRTHGEAQSSTFRYWMNFLDAAFLLLRLLRAERDGDFDLHMLSVTESVHWFWAAGRTNYARFTPVYIADMLALKTTNPQAYEHLENGGFVVRRRSGHAFNAVPTDQALEQTINKEAKGSGGIIGFTRRKGALTRWLVTRHILGEFCGQFRETVSKNQGASQHEELGKSRKERDEADVDKVVDLVTTQYQNPFDLNTVSERLVNIATGQVASADIEKSMNEFRVASQEAVDKFVSERISKERTVKFWEPIPRSKVKTFSNMRKPFATSKTSKLMLDSEVLFRRLLAVANHRDIEMNDVLKHELASVPPALFHDDGTMRKTNKAELTKKLESFVEEINEFPVQQADTDSNTAYIIDAMALLQSLNEGHFKTFDQLGAVVLKHIMSHFTRDKSITSVTVVFDRYDKASSLKEAERQRRTANSDVPAYMVSGGRTVPNYRRFLSNSENKASLAAFVCEYVAVNAPGHLKQQLSIVLAGGFRNGREVQSVTKEGTECLSNLFSSQEEADTRMVLHATHMAQTHGRILIRTDDTDVLVILLYYYYTRFADTEIYMHTGHRTRHAFRNRFVPIHSIAQQIGQTVSSCLPAMHALTGCDTNSSIYKVGKRTSFNKLVKSADKLRELSKVGLSESIDECLPVARRYTMMLFGGFNNKTSGKPYDSMDEIRLAIATSTDKSATQLPPTEDAFKHHVMRARVQTIVWCQSHIPDPEVPDPVGNGWKKDENGILVPVYFANPPAPVFLRDLTHLYCKDGNCNSSKCQCHSVGLQCIDICRCQHECTNRTTAVTIGDSDSDDESEPT